MELLKQLVMLEEAWGRDPQADGDWGGPRGMPSHFQSIDDLNFPTRDVNGYKIRIDSIYPNDNNDGIDEMSFDIFDKSGKVVTAEVSFERPLSVVGGVDRNKIPQFDVFVDGYGSLSDARENELSDTEHQVLSNINAVVRSYLSVYSSDDLQAVADILSDNSSF